MLHIPHLPLEPNKHTLATVCIQFRGVHRKFEADQIKNPRHLLDNLSEFCWSYNSEQGLLRAYVPECSLQ